MGKGWAWSGGGLVVLFSALEVTNGKYGGGGLGLVWWRIDGGECYYGSNQGGWLSNIFVMDQGDGWFVQGLGQVWWWVGLMVWAI
jgi:hypothetical protein